MTARCAYAVFTERADSPPERLLADADVPRLDPSVWTLTASPLGGDDDPLRRVLSTLAGEREPPIPRRTYPRTHLYRQALVVEVTRADSLHPDALAFAVGAVSALAAWADGPVVDLTAERVWTEREWRKRVAAKRFDVARHVSVHSDWAADGDSATLHTHGLAKFDHPELVALDVPVEGTRAAGQLLGHLAAVRALTLETLLPGHAFDPGYGQPMVAFVPLPTDHVVGAHLGAPPSVVVDYDVDTDEAVDGLYGLLGAARALDRVVPADRVRRPLASLRPTDAPRLAAEAG